MRIILNLILFTQVVFKNPLLFSANAQLEVKMDTLPNENPIVNEWVAAALNPKFDESTLMIEKIVNFNSETPLAMQNFKINSFESTLLHHALRNFRLLLSKELIQSLSDEIEGSAFDNIASPPWAIYAPLEFMLTSNLPEDLRLSVTKSLLERKSSLYLRRSRFAYKTILQAAIIKNLNPQFCELLVSIGGVPPGHHPDYITDHENLLSSPLGLAVMNVQKPDFEELLSIFVQNGADINELIPVNATWNATVLGILCGLPWDKYHESKDDYLYKVSTLLIWGSRFNINDNFDRNSFKLARIANNGYLFPNAYFPFILLDYLLDIFPHTSSEIRFLRFVPLSKHFFRVMLPSLFLIIYTLSAALNSRFKKCKKFVLKEEKKDTDNELLENKSTASPPEKKSDTVKSRTKEKNVDNETPSPSVNPNPNDEAKINKNLPLCPEKFLNSNNNDKEIKIFLSNYFAQNLDLNSFWGERGDTLLMHLIRSGHIESAKFMIDKIMNKYPHLINEVNNYGQTALIVGCQSNTVVIVSYLLNEEKIPNLYVKLRDKRGDNALFIWLQHSLQPLKQTFSCAKKLIQRGCELTEAARTTTTFLQFDDKQRNELEMLASEQTGNLENKRTTTMPMTKTKNQRRKSADIITSSPPFKKTSLLKREQRKKSLPINSEELKPHDDLLFQQNRRLFDLFYRDIKYLISAFFRKSNTPLERFCRHAELLMLILDLSKTIENFNKSNGNYSEKSLAAELMYYIRHSVIPLLLKANSTSALSAVEEMANQFIQWIPASLSKKIQLMPFLTAEEMQEFSTPIQCIVNFFQQKNLSGLELGQSKLFQEIVRFHSQMSGAEFVPAKHEAYVIFALPIINEIYTKISLNLKYKDQSSSQRVLVILLFSCGDAYSKYNNPNQSRAFSDFVDTCRIMLRNPLMHDPNLSFLNVEQQSIQDLCAQAQQASHAQGLSPKPNWKNTAYDYESAQQHPAAAILSSCSFFAKCPSPSEAKFIEKTVLEYLGSPIKRKKTYEPFIPATIDVPAIGNR